MEGGTPPERKAPALSGGDGIWRPVMRRRLTRGITWLVLLSAAIAVTALHRPGTALATTAEGYKSTLLALGRFGEIDVFSSLPRGLNGKGNELLWQSLQKTKGPSDVYVQSNVWAPGGSTGWHSHPGDSLIIVTAGAVTDYEGHDPNCKPHVYKTGMGFVDPGGGHVHILRNEGDVEAKTIAVQLIPADAARRIDVADPGNCHF
jgi:quercetin dioxygenase-like cupin family protein